MCMASRAESLHTCTINNSLEKNTFWCSIFLCQVRFKRLPINLEHRKNCKTTLTGKINAVRQWILEEVQDTLWIVKFYESNLVCQSVFVFVFNFVSLFVFVFVFVFAEIQLVGSHQCVTQSSLRGKKSIRSSAGARRKT